LKWFSFTYLLCISLREYFDFLQQGVQKFCFFWKMSNFYGLFFKIPEHQFFRTPCRYWLLARTHISVYVLARKLPELYQVLTKILFLLYLPLAIVNVLSILINVLFIIPFVDYFYR
jgi:hypothetical protein